MVRGCKAMPACPKLIGTGANLMVPPGRKNLLSVDANCGSGVRLYVGCLGLAYAVVNEGTDCCHSTPNEAVGG